MIVWVIKFIASNNRLVFHLDHKTHHQHKLQKHETACYFNNEFGTPALEIDRGDGDGVFKRSNCNVKGRSEAKQKHKPESAKYGRWYGCRPDSSFLAPSVKTLIQDEEKYDLHWRPPWLNFTLTFPFTAAPPAAATNTCAPPRRTRVLLLTFVLKVLVSFGSSAANLSEIEDLSTTTTSCSESTVFRFRLAVVHHHRPPAIVFSTVILAEPISPSTTGDCCFCFRLIVATGYLDAAYLDVAYLDAALSYSATYVSKFIK
ncbi:hypothetical protein LXL04_004183 [Taraxacum kok-saghyz]